MSRAYRIALAETLRRHVTVEDGVQSTLELLPVLPAPRMGELLGAELAGLGFVREGDEACRVEGDRTRVSVDLRSGTVTVRVARDHDLELQQAGESATWDPRRVARAEAQLRERLRDELEQRVGAERERLRAELTARLERRLRDLRQQLDGAVNRTIAAALKQKAAQLGEIEEISEDAETGSLTIRVRL